MPLKHVHFLARAEVKNPPKDLPTINAWIENLITDMGMNILYGPFSMSCDLENNEGITAGAILSTSHCVIHTWDKCSPAIMQVDIYTCSDLDPSFVWDKLEQFGPTKIDYKFLDRETGLTEISPRRINEKLQSVIACRG